MSSITSPPAKLTLASTSSMSLHDRFTKLAKSRPVVSPKQQSSVSIVKPELAPTRASAKNRQLALQMANRPSVQAALKLKNKSIRQRLGVNANRPLANSIYKLRNNGNGPAPPMRGIPRPPINGGVQQQRQLKARLTIGNGRIDPSRLSSFAPNKPIIIRGNSGGGMIARGGRVQRGGLNRRSLDSSGNNSLRRVGAGNGMKRGRNLKARLNNSFGGNTNVKRGGSGNFVKSNRGGAGSMRGGGGGGRGARRGAGRRGGRGGGGLGAGGQVKGQKPQAPKSKENLDMDLDQYMAKSKNHLDADLDSYMAQAQST